MLNKPTIIRAFDNKAPVSKSRTISVRSSITLTYDRSPFLYDYRSVVRSRSDRDIYKIYMACCELYLTHREAFDGDRTVLSKLVIDRCKAYGCSTAREASVAAKLVARGSDLNEFIDGLAPGTKVVPLYWCVDSNTMVLKVGVV